MSVRSSVRVMLQVALPSVVVVVLPSGLAPMQVMGGPVPVRWRVRNSVWPGRGVPVVVVSWGLGVGWVRWVVVGVGGGGRGGGGGVGWGGGRAGGGAVSSWQVQVAG